MAQISSAGIGSGLDVNSIVSQLIAAEGRSKTLRLDLQEAEIQAQLSAFGSLKGALSTFKSSLSALVSASSYGQKYASSSDSTVVSASASGSAAAGTYGIEITALATAHALNSGTFAESSTVVATGTLTISLGTMSGTFTANADRKTVSITIDSTNNTLSGIRDAINESDAEVTAAIIYDGSGYRLTLVSDYSGLDNSIKMTVAGDSVGSDTDTNGLSQLAYDPEAGGGSGKNLNQSRSAVDAELKINGLSLTSSTNEITTAIEGVTLNLKETTAASETITVSASKSAVTSGISSLVTSYNAFVANVSAISGYNTATETGGILLGDSTVRSITSQIRTLMGSTIGNLSSGYNSLAVIGITTNADGTLKVDKVKLNEALDSDPDAIQRLFAAIGTPDNSQVSFVSSSSSTVVGTYSVNVTQAASRGDYVGAADSISLPVTVTAGSNTFSLKVDGVQSGMVTITAGSYTTGASLAAEIQSRINGESAISAAGVSVVVSYVSDGSGGHLDIKSTAYGSDSSIEIDSDNTSGLGLTGGTSTTGLDVEGTIGGVAATGIGRNLTGAGDATGLVLAIDDGVSGSLGSVSFTQGLAYKLDDYLDQLLDAKGILQTREDGFDGRIESINEQRETLIQRLEKLETRYRKQFAALDALVSQLQSTSNYLTQQLANLPGAIKLRR